MLTSYLVKCPHFGCDWFGSLLPRGNPEAGQTAQVVVFECPHCGGEWQARVRGDDVIPLPLPELAEQHA